MGNGSKYTSAVLRAWFDCGVSEMEAAARLGARTYTKAAKELAEGRRRWEALPPEARERLDAFFRALCWVVDSGRMSPAEAVRWDREPGGAVDAV